MQIPPRAAPALEPAFAYAASHGSTEMIVMQAGKVVRHEHWGERRSGDVASVQKSVVAILIGIAQQQNLLDVRDSVSGHIGPGWTRLSADRERTITIEHLLTMTSGMTDRLEFEADPGTHWRYNTAAYHHLKLVLEAASGRTLDDLTRQWLSEPLDLRPSAWRKRPTAPEMARIGQLILQQGRWNGTTVIEDDGSFRAMLSRSQTLNPAYGYLWWLNAEPVRATSQVPGETRFPQAPADLVAAMGARNQRIYVVPNLELVVVRVGGAVPSDTNGTFDHALWRELEKGIEVARRGER